MGKKLNVLITGIGRMGSIHTMAYHQLPGFNIAGMADLNESRAREICSSLDLDIPVFTDFYQAVDKLNPEVVSICTHTNTHADFAVYAMSKGAHIFVEKPIARSAEEADKVRTAIVKTGRKFIVGYILRRHPSWQRFIDMTQELGKPLIMRMNLNQQSYAERWATHKSFIEKLPPLVDCGVHYVDVMCQMTRSKPKMVNGIGARVTSEIEPDKVNYGQLQVVFEDNSVGWYEVGWGPMMSKTSNFIKDVIGPAGSVSIDKDPAEDPSSVKGHTEAERLIRHFSDVDGKGLCSKEDEIISFPDSPSHDELCKLEQEYLYKAVTEDIDILQHVDDAVNSLKICLAAVESYETGKTVYLD